MHKTFLTAEMLAWINEHKLDVGDSSTLLIVSAMVQMRYWTPVRSSFQKSESFPLPLKENVALEPPLSPLLGCIWDSQSNRTVYSSSEAIACYWGSFTEIWRKFRGPTTGYMPETSAESTVEAWVPLGTSHPSFRTSNQEPWPLCISFSLEY